MEHKGARVVGISTDDRDTLRRFKLETKAPFTLLSDPKGKVSEKYSGLMPIPGIAIAKRANVVVGADGKVQALVTGGDAVDPYSAIASCPLHQGGS